jgi:hypothetical protein
MRDRLRFTTNRVAATFVVLTLTAFAGFACWAWVSGSTPGFVPPARDYCVGVSEDEVLGRLGPPSGSSNGHFGNPHAEWANQYEPARTHTYVRAGGTLCVSVYRKDGKWVCFSSDWLPAGGAY